MTAHAHAANMFRTLIFTILSLFSIINGIHMTKSRDQHNDLDIFKESLEPALNKEPSDKATSNSYYSLIAPGLLKSNRKYSVVVSLHNATEPCYMRVSITDELFNVTENVNIQPFKSKLVDFYLPKLYYGYYTLKAEGVSGCSFSQEKLLLAEVDNGPKIYIQTDKAVYKPEDLIQFRVLFLDEHTRPLVINEPILVEILDAKENIVKTFKDVHFTTGVYTNSFLLSERPLMGSWTIRVSVSGIYSHTRSKTVEVKKYVLPKFSVHIKTPKHVVTDDAAIKAIIYGKYTFGKYVQGVATVQLWNRFNNKMWQEKTIDVKTLAGVKFPLANVNEFTTDEFLNLVVMLKENFTSIAQNESIVIKLHKQRYNIYVNDEDFEFKGFEPYRLKAHIEQWNGGAAIVDSETAVTLVHGQKSYESHFDAKGVANFEFEYDPNGGFAIDFKDSSFYLPSIFASRKEDNSSVFYCRLKLVGERLQLGAPAKILISSSEDIPHLVYTVVGHGNIVRMQHIKLPPKQKSYTIHIKPTIEMIPISYVHVHYSAKGIFRSNELELVFPKEFENKVSLAAPNQAKPGEEITLELNAQPQSFVGILAVDLGVHLLDPSYDLQRDDIMSELQEDKSHIYAPYIEDGEFLHCGLIVLTNIKRELLGIGAKKPIRKSDEGPVNFRTQFPEVWIFQNIQVNSTTTKMSFKLPDSITSWRITAFSVNDRTGLGIVKGPTDVTAIKPFFISLNLPYSVKWGEILTLSVLVFNYDPHSLDSVVTMFNDDKEFEFMESVDNGTEKSKDQRKKLAKSIIPSNDVRAFSFYIKPLKVGQISLRITASNKLYTDGVQQQLKVESEGISKNINQAVYVNSNNDSSSSLRVDTPTDVDPATNEVSLSVGGDYIVPTLHNLRNLVEMPTGCGEQNMIHFAPNILILQYLKTNGEYTKEKELVKKIKNYIDIGYQQQLSYRHNKGGYSVFGQRVDDEASTWLTAYVIRFFIKASKYASIERRIIDTGLQYLSNAQLDDGSFPYTGYLFNPIQQNQYGLTAFILATFLEDRVFARKYQQVIEKGLQFLTKNIEELEDVYSLSIMAFVLQMAKNSQAQTALKKLQTYRKEENGLIWWSDQENFSENNVEITGYVLMALLDTGTASDHMPILEWLLKQRNDRGGFLSTQDTVVGLQALVKFNQKFTNDKNVSFAIKYTAKDEQGDELERGEFKLKEENFLDTQKHVLPPTTHNVSLEISGAGSALVQLSHYYKLLDAAAQSSPAVLTDGNQRKKYEVSADGNDKVQYFVIDPKVDILKNDDLELDVCFTYKTKTNMVILEVDLPSGYHMDEETLADIQNNAFVQRTETEKEFTKIIVYLGRLEVDVENCINFLSYKTMEVWGRKSVPIVMYDYYNVHIYNATFYIV